MLGLIDSQTCSVIDFGPDSARIDYHLYQQSDVRKRIGGDISSAFLRLFVKATRFAAVAGVDLALQDLTREIRYLSKYLYLRFA